MTFHFSFSCSLNRQPLPDSARFANTSSMSNTLVFTERSLSSFLLTGCGSAIWKPAMVTHTHTDRREVKINDPHQNVCLMLTGSQMTPFFPHNLTSVEPNAHCSCWLPRLGVGQLPWWDDCTSHGTTYPCIHDQGFLVAHNTHVHQRHTPTYY